MKKDKLIAVRLNKEVYDYLNKEAEKNKLNLSAYIRLLLSKKLKIKFIPEKVIVNSK